MQNILQFLVDETAMIAVVGAIAFILGLMVTSFSRTTVGAVIGYISFYMGIIFVALPIYILMLTNGYRTLTPWRVFGIVSAIVTIIALIAAFISECIDGDYKESSRTTLLLRLVVVLGTVCCVVAIGGANF